MSTIVIGCNNSKPAKRENNSFKSLTTALSQISQKGTGVGFSVSIVEKNKIIYAEGFGYSKIDEGEYYSTQTIQNIASISKTMIGISLLKAEEQGFLSLNDPINLHLPFKVVNPHYPKDQIRILDLATHTSTILDTKYYDLETYILQDFEDIRNYRIPEINEKFNSLDSVESLPDFLFEMLSVDGNRYSNENFMDSRPGEKFEYSNVGAALAAFIIQHLTGVAYSDYVQENIFTPLHMRNTGWSFRYTSSNNLATPYFTKQIPLPQYTSVTYPDGGIMTNIEDLSLYLLELMDGYYGKGKLISNQAYKKLFTRYLDDKKLEQSFDYDDEFNTGIFMGFTPNNLIGHTGGDPGVASAMFFDPKTERGFILLSNTSVNNDVDGKQFMKILNILNNGKLIIDD